MKQPGSILLISCYELGHQPNGLALPMGFLRQAGFDPNGLDVARQDLDPDLVRQARLVGISVPMHTALRLGVRVARRVREINPTSHICFYGLYASLNAEHLVGELGASVLSGECEESLVQLAQALESGTDLSAVPDLTLRDRTAPPVLRRLSFPAPIRDQLLPLDKYVKLEAEGIYRSAGYVEASRGCRHRCRHCPIPPVYDGRFFIVPRPVVLEDIRNQVRSGATHITFGDPDFLNGPGHSMPLVREMHQEFPQISFDFTAKIEHLLRFRELLPELSQLGGLFVVSAVESLENPVLEILDKGHTREDVEAVLEITRSAGLTLRPTLIPFNPWTSLQNYLSLFDFMERKDLVEAVDPVQYAVRLLIPPGSYLLDHPRVRPHLGPLKPDLFTFQWKHPDSRMDELQREVAARVEHAGHSGADPRSTFLELRRLAHSFLSPAPILPPPRAVSSPPRRLPRLTESWFC